MWVGKVKMETMKREDLICFRCLYSNPGNMTIEEALDERMAYPIPCSRYAVLVCSSARTLPTNSCGEGIWRASLSSNRTDRAWKDYTFESQDLLE